MMDTPFSRCHAARGLTLAVSAATGLALATPAHAEWHHDRHWRRHGWVAPYGYAAPPVVYSAPVYAPPPVVYSPGINVGIRLGR